MATSYSREQIVDLAVQMLGAGATLDDAINAAANYGVDLASVYYSEPGTTVSVDVPADTGPVDTGPVDTGPVDTGPIYSEPDNSGFEDFIVDPRSGSSGSGPVQSPLSTVSSGSVDTGPVDTGPVSSEPAYTQKQYRDAGQFIAQNIDKPEVIAKVAQDLGLSTQDILAAAQTVNTGVTTGDVENYLSKATSPVDTGPVVTAGALPTVSSTDTSATVTSPLESMASGSALGASSTSSQGGTSPLDTAGSTGTTPLDTVSPTVTDKFYDPKLKANWGVESVGDFGLQNDPRFHGQGSQFYIDPVTGKYLTEQEYLSTANTPEALKYQADQAEKERLQGIYTSVGNQVRSFIDPNSSGGSWTKESGLDSGPGFGVQGMLDQLGQRIVEKTGVTDLNNLQLKYVDKPVTETIYAFAGDDGTQYRRLVPDPATGESTYQALTPDEISRLRTERDVDGNTTTLLDSTVKQGQVYDKSTGKLVSDSESINLGDWGQGPGITYGSINFDENGKPIVSTSGEDTTAGIVKAAAQLGPVVTIANVLSGGALTPLQLAVNAVSAVDAANRGNILPLIATAAGAGGYTGIIDPSLASNIQTGVSAIGALDKGNVLGALATVAGSGLGSEVGSIDLGGGLKVTDALNAVSAVDSLVKGDIAGALTLAGKAAGSDELQTAGTALKVINAIESGNLNAAVSAGAQLYNNVNQLVDKSQVASLLANSAGIGAIDADLGADLGGLKASTVAGALGNDTVTGALGSLNPTEDEQIALGQLNQAATSLVKDYVSAGGSMEPTDLSAALSKLTDPYGRPLPATEVDRLVTAAQGQLDTQTRNQKIQTDTLSVLADYTGRDSDLSRESAYERLVAAGNSGDRANEILASVDAQVEANRAARATTQAQNQAAIAAGAGEFSGADERAAIAAGAGEFTGTDKAAAINTRISNATSFNDAYAIARKEFGPNATFNYQGKLYSTATAEERPDLTGKVSSTSQVTDTPYVAPNGMHNRAAFIQAGGGTSDADYAKYVQAVNALVSEGKSGTLIKPSSVNSTGKELPSTTGPVTMEKPRVDSVLGSVAAQGVASFGANSIAGVLNSLGFTDAGKTVLDKANQIAAAATAAEGADITKGKADINAAIKKVGESSDIKDFAANVGNLASTAFNNPKAFGATVGSEVVEELLQFATLKFPASFLVKETVASALENAGAAYNTEYESQIAKGASKEDAHQAAQKAAGTAAGVSVALGGAAAGLGKVAGKVIGSQADEVPTSGVGQVGKTTLKESAQETVEEGSIAGAIDLALGRPVDAVNVLTNMTGGALYGGPTSGVMQGTKLDTLDQAASTSIGSGLGADSISASIKSGASIDTTVKSALDAGADTTVVVGAAINSALDTGMSTGTVVSSTVGSAVSGGADSTIVIDSALSAVAQSGGDVSQAAGSAVTASLNAGANANETIIAATSSAIKNGSDVGSAVTTVIAGAVQGGASLSDASASSVATAIVGGANADTVIKAVTDSNSGVSVKADTGNNVTTVVASDATSNTKVVMDSNSKSVVTTTTDTNTGTKTQTTMQGDTTITTTTDTNTGITTQTTTNTNTNSTTTVNTNTNTTTNTTTNNKTNTTTNTSVNTDTGDAVITVVDDKTGEVIDTKVTTIDQLPTDVKETLTVDVKTDTTTDKTTTTKAPAVKAPAFTMPKAATAGAGMSLIGDIGRLPGTMLKTAGDPTLKDPLAALSQKVEEMNQIDPALLAVMAQRLGMQMPQAPQEPTFTYGQETSIDDILGLREPKAPEEEETAFAEGGFVEPLRAKAMNPQFMNHGGALPGGRENFKHGKHVAGEGDGQSDDIPAWLADGEFVFPADVVSALGNGSTKAGTDKLYKMMHEIRARARSTKVKDLPPPAHKSPLDYLKRGK